MVQSRKVQLEPSLPPTNSNPAIGADLNVLCVLKLAVTRGRARALLMRVFTAAEAAWDAVDVQDLKDSETLRLGRTLRAWAVRTHLRRLRKLQAAANQLALAWR